MGRQLPYPVFPSAGSYAPTVPEAWVFLFHNEKRAPELAAAWLNNEFNRLEIKAMAKRANKQGTTVSREKADWTGFANIDLSAEDKAAIRGGVLDGESVLDICADILGSGHKIALSYDREKDTTTVAATGVYRDCVNAGLTLTCFARSLTDAITVLAYKHEVVAKGDWRPFVRAARPIDDIG